MMADLNAEAGSAASHMQHEQRDVAKTQANSFQLLTCPVFNVNPGF